MTWRKYPQERILAGADWTRLLDGAQLAGTVAVEAIGATLTVELAGQEGNITKLWIEGGTPRIYGQAVRLTATTDEGELLTGIVPVEVFQG